MFFDMKGKSEASLLYDVKILNLNHSPPLQGINGADTMTERH